MLIQFAARLERRPLNLKLKQLSLKTMRCQLHHTISEAAATSLSLVQTLEPLADLELEARKARPIERRFRLSRLQARHSIDSFRFHHHRTRTQRQLPAPALPRRVPLLCRVPHA
jgi:hypothetical protein